MLMTDITGSTDRAAQMGDAAWDQLLERHNGLVREVIEQYRGQEIDTTGDGFLIVFDGAARALQAAADIRAAVGGIGLEIHAGIHTGEVELVPGNIRGLAVHETARIMALAGAGEILVSSTTKELVSASGVTFEDRGRHVLKGVPGERQVYAANWESELRVRWPESFCLSNQRARRRRCGRFPTPNGLEVALGGNRRPSCGCFFPVSRHSRNSALPPGSVSTDLADGW